MWKGARKVLSMVGGTGQFDIQLPNVCPESRRREDTLDKQRYSTATEGEFAVQVGNCEALDGCVRWPRRLEKAHMKKFGYEEEAETLGSSEPFLDTFQVFGTRLEGEHSEKEDATPYLVYHGLWGVHERSECRVGRRTGGEFVHVFWRRSIRIVRPSDKSVEFRISRRRWRNWFLLLFGADLDGLDRRKHCDLSEEGTGEEGGERHDLEAREGAYG